MTSMVDPAVSGLAELLQSLWPVDRLHSCIGPYWHKWGRHCGAQWRPRKLQQK